MSQKHHSPSTDKKSEQTPSTPITPHHTPSDKAIDSAIDRGIIEKALDDLVNKTSKDVTIIALASENGTLHSSLKGSSLKIATILHTIFLADDEQSKSLATILVHVPFIFCQSADETNPQRAKEIYQMLTDAYNDLRDSYQPPIL